MMSGRMSVSTNIEMFAMRIHFTAGVIGPGPNEE